MMRNLIGQQLGDYRLVRFLGRGGFARVSLSQHAKSEILPAQNHSSHAPKVSDAPQPILQPTSYLSRRAMIAGLVKLTLVGGSITWLTASCSPSEPASHITPTSIGTLLFTYKGHPDWIMAVAWSPDSKRIASGSVDNTVQVWVAS